MPCTAQTVAEQPAQHDSGGATALYTQVAAVRAASLPAPGSSVEPPDMPSAAAQLALQQARYAALLHARTAVMPPSLATISRATAPAPQLLPAVPGPGAYTGAFGSHPAGAFLPERSHSWANVACTAAPPFSAARLLAPAAAFSAQSGHGAAMPSWQQLELRSAALSRHIAAPVLAVAPVPGDLTQLASSRQLPPRPAVHQPTWARSFKVCSCSGYAPAKCGPGTVSSLMRRGFSADAHVTIDSSKRHES